MPNFIRYSIPLALWALDLGYPALADELHRHSQGKLGHHPTLAELDNRGLGRNLTDIEQE